MEQRCLRMGSDNQCFNQCHRVQLGPSSMDGCMALAPGGAWYTGNEPGCTELGTDEDMKPSWSGLDQGNTEDTMLAIQVCAIGLSLFLNTFSVLKYKISKHSKFTLNYKRI